MRRLYNPQRPLFCQWPDHKISKELQEISNILDDLPEIKRWIHQDLKGAKSLKDTGRCGMTSDQVLRATILKQQNSWSYEFLELQCVDSQTTKAFLRLNEGEFFSRSCLHENLSKIKPETWQKINDQIVQYAADCGIEKGRTVRMDSTVIETNIHRAPRGA